uniref:Uncharacterized protein n=1 Tax=Arundo donax TaxID=35708 RepID=A0A0A9BV04_ARUDO
MIKQLTRCQLCCYRDVKNKENGS